MSSAGSSQMKLIFQKFNMHYIEAYSKLPMLSAEIDCSLLLFSASTFERSVQFWNDNCEKTLSLKPVFNVCGLQFRGLRAATLWSYLIISQQYLIMSQQRIQQSEQKHSCNFFRSYICCFRASSCSSNWCCTVVVNLLIKSATYVIIWVSKLQQSVKMLNRRHYTCNFLVIPHELTCVLLLFSH